MGHFTAEEWGQFKQNTLQQGRRREMEQHLLGCAACLEAYLSTIGEGETEFAELLLPADFTLRALELLEKRKGQAHNSHRWRILSSYIAAASITLALMAGGAFEFAARAIPNIMEETRSATQSIHHKTTVNWTDQLLENTTARINRLLSSEEDDINE
jgi:anti-sigma factor RsiW